MLIDWKLMYQQLDYKKNSYVALVFKTGMTGMAGHVPGTASAHAQNFQGTAGWGQEKYIYKF